MKNAIIGTAGHVDHGKTLLIKALTGIDTDRLKEEKKRGITIELGFAHITLPNGEIAGIIDVPGHEKFIKNMLAGAGGIDLALLVVAADEGFMPQTREHLEILSLLDIRQGIIVLTKKDLVDQDWLDYVSEEIRSEVAGSFLENAPILPVSSYTGEGIEALKSTIAERLQSVEPKNTQKPFRLPADRVFTMEGFGTVVTGTLIEGTLKEGDKVMLYPSGEAGRVRNLQVHGQSVEQAFAGQRTAVNIAGLKKNEVVRGDVLAQPDSMTPTLMMDVMLSILPNCARQITNGQRLHFYHGARDVLCKLVLLGNDELEAGKSGYAQLRFAEPVAAKQGDHFVVRFYSPLETVGGGVILDPNPVKHKRSDASVTRMLAIKESGSSADKLSQAILEASPRFEPLETVARRFAPGGEPIDEDLASLISDGSVVMLTEKIALHNEYLQTLQQSLTRMLSAHHKANPLQAGMRREEVRAKLVPNKDSALCDRVFELFEQRGLIRTDGLRIALKEFEVIYTPAQRKLADAILAIYRDGGFAPPSPDEIVQQFTKERDFKQVSEALLADGHIISAAPQVAFSYENYLKALDLLRAAFTKTPQITLADFRDILDTSRKYAVALLEYFDRQGFTRKVGDARMPGKAL